MAISRITDLPGASRGTSGLLAGRYELVSVLGRGAMGEVYKARHVHAGRVVALKVVSAEFASDERVCARVRAEARACSAARHPNIVEIFDAGELEDGRPYVAMEYLEGRQLLALFESEGPLSVARVCRIMLEVTRAVAAAHSVGIIHRDLKAENVMLVSCNGRETAKVLDFGIAAALNPPGGRMTRAGIGMGTPEYMAPEQIYGATPTPRCDIYALGVLLFEALAGTLPFYDEETSAILHNKATTPAPSIADRRSDLPKPLAKVIDACLALDPADRPSTADELARVLGAYVDEDRVMPTPPVRRRRGPLILGIAAVITSLVILVAVRPGPSKTAVPALALITSVAHVIPGAPAVAPSVARMEPALDAKVSAPDVSVAPGPIVPAIAAVSTEPAKPSLAASSNPPRGGQDRSAPRRAVPVTRPTSDPAASDDCIWARRQVEDFRNAPNWAGVLRETARTACWSARDRARLRVKAFFELHRYAECKKAADSIDDPEVQRLVKSCAMRLKEPG